MVLDIYADIARNFTFMDERTGALGHRVRFGRDIGVNTSDDVFRCRRTLLDCFKYVSLSFQTVVNVFINLTVCV
jgi:hypothetical protein